MQILDKGYYWIETEFYRATVSVNYTYDNKRGTQKTFQNSGYYNSVSYTHLRSHETVLELVCRLLLEQKNHEYTSTHHTPDANKHTHTAP
ncbi:hypothetical protein HpBGD84_17280 [Helicobacter pylori]